MGDGRVAFIAGGSKGFGADIARAFAPDIEHIILNARNVDDLNRVAHSIKAKDHHVHIDVMPFDLANKDPQQLARDLTTLVTHIRDKYGKLDIAVYNAGAFRLVDPLTAHDLEQDDTTLHNRISTICTEIDEVMGVNIGAMQKLAQILKPLQEKALAPKAVMLSSEGALRARFSNVAYGPSKVAIARLGFDIFVGSQGRIETYRLFPGNFLSPGNSGREGVLYLDSVELARQSAEMVLTGSATDLYAVQLPDGPCYVTSRIDYAPLKKKLADQKKRFEVSAELSSAFYKWLSSNEVTNLMRLSAAQDID